MTCGVGFPGPHVSVTGGGLPPHPEWIKWRGSLDAGARLSAAAARRGDRRAHAVGLDMYARSGVLLLRRVVLARRDARARCVPVRLVLPLRSCSRGKHKSHSPTVRRLVRLVSGYWRRVKLYTTLAVVFLFMGWRFLSTQWDLHIFK